MTIEELIDELKQFPYDSEITIRVNQTDDYYDIKSIRKTMDEDLSVVDDDNIIIEC
jgi:hypothetical protein